MQGGNVCILHACSLMFLSCTNFMYRTTITLWLEGLRAWGLIGTHQRLGLTRLRHVVGLNDISSAAALRMAYQLWSYRSLSAACIQSLGEKTWSSMTYHQIMYRYVSMELRISKTHHWKPTEGPPLSCMNPLGISLQDHLLNFQGANLRLKAHVQHSIRLIQDQKPGANHDEPRWDSVISHRSGKQNNMWVMTIGRYYPVSWWIFTDMFDSQNEPGPKNVQPAGTIQLKSGWWITFWCKKKPR